MTTAEDRARMRAYYWAHRDKLIAYNREYQRSYKKKKKPLTIEEKLKRAAYQREYYARNKERMRANQKAWLEKHPGYMAEHAKKYRQQLKELEL